MSDHDRKLREALLAMVDVMPYLHPNPNSPNAAKWQEWKEAAIDKAAAALDASVVVDLRGRGGEMEDA